MTIQALAQQISDNLKTIVIKDSDEERRIVWKDDAPKDLREWFQDVTSDITGFSFAELDECYIVLEDLCDIISEQSDDATADQIELAISDHEWAYIYNADLLDWAKGNLHRISDVDDALQEGASDVMGAIQQAMDRTRSGYASQILSKMVERVDNA